MKKYLPFLLVAMLAVFASCSKDDNDKTVYIVTFETDGGTPVPSVQRVEEGSMASPPGINPVKTGYVFSYWHVSGAASAYNFQTPVNGDMTLYAKWQEEATAEYWQVTWNLNGGTWPPDDNHTKQVVKGGTLAEPTSPTKAGSTFDGWYKEFTFTNKVSFPCFVTNDLKLYAKWKTSTQEEVGINISGIIWATRNVGAPGTFASTPEDAGMFYQWGKNVGWSITDPLIGSDGSTTWDRTNTEGKIWPAETDPCPEGWRVPSSSELSKLTIGTQVPALWGELNGVIGGLFGTSPNTIFLPAAGHRYTSSSSDGTLSYVGQLGCYWANNETGQMTYWPKYFSFASNNKGIYSIHGQNGQNVRCVKDASSATTE